MRCRLAVGLATAAMLAGCGGSVAPPATGAAGVVPSDALAYLHISIDRGRPPVTEALGLARRMPGVARLLAGLDERVGALIGASSLHDGARGWLGAEAAAAVIPLSAGHAGLLYVLAVRDRPAAVRFLAAHPVPGGSESALVGNYVVIGPPAAVEASRAVGHGRAASLFQAPAFRRASAGEPPARVIDAYASSAGLRELLPGRGRLAGGLLTLLDRPGLEAVALSLSPRSGGGRVVVRSVLSGPAPAAGFSPSLPGRLPGAVALLLDTHDLPAAAPRLFAALGAAGILGRVQPLLHRLGDALHAEGVDVGAVESLFGGETAVAVTSTADRPTLLIVARTAQPKLAQLALASIEPSVAALFPPSGTGAGQAALFTQRQIGGVTVHELQLAPGLAVDYAVFHGLIVVSTGSAAIASLAAVRRPLVGGALYSAVGGSGARKVSSLLFLDLSQLIRLGAQTGLLGGASDTLAIELARIRAIGLRSTGGKNESTAELSFTIS